MASRVPRISSSISLIHPSSILLRIRLSNCVCSLWNLICRAINSFAILTIISHIHLFICFPSFVYLHYASIHSSFDSSLHLCAILSSSCFIICSSTHPCNNRSTHWTTHPPTHSNTSSSSVHRHLYCIPFSHYLLTINFHLLLPNVHFVRFHLLAVISIFDFTWLYTKCLPVIRRLRRVLRMN